MTADEVTMTKPAIAVDTARVAELRIFMSFTCAHFEQECLYFKVGANVDFLDNPLGWP